MIVNFADKTYEIQSDRKPDENWMGDGWMAMDENSELGKKIIAHAPFYDFVYEEDKVVDITPLERQEVPNPILDPFITLQNEVLLNSLDIDARLSVLELGLK